MKSLDLIGALMEQEKYIQSQNMIADEFYFLMHPENKKYLRIGLNMTDALRWNATFGCYTFKEIQIILTTNVNEMEIKVVTLFTTQKWI